MDHPVAHSDSATRDPATRERRITARSLTAAAVVAAGALAVGVLAGCTSDTSALIGPTPSFSVFSPPPTLVGKAAIMADFAKLRIRTTAAPSGYSPDIFGKGWGKVTGSSCTADNFVFTRDLTNKSFKDGATCIVASGALFDPYSGQWHWYERSSALPSAVGIDRVISLADAWASGAYNWNSKILHGFANDPDELLAAGTAELAVRNGAGTSSWLPPDAADRCVYVAQQVKVKATYYLTVTQAEHDAMAGVLENCPQIMSAARPKSAPPPPPSASPSAAQTLQPGGSAPRRRVAVHQAQPTSRPTTPSPDPAASPPPSAPPTASPDGTPTQSVRPAATPPPRHWKPPWPPQPSWQPQPTRPPDPTAQPTPPDQGGQGQGGGGGRHHGPHPH